MKIILVDARHGASRSVTIKGWMRLGLSLCLLGLPMLIGYGAYLMAEARGVKLARDAAAEAWTESMREQEADLAKVKDVTLHHSPTCGAAVLHDAPVVMQFPVFEAFLRTKEHDAVSHGREPLSRG